MKRYTLTLLTMGVLTGCWGEPLAPGPRAGATASSADLVTSTVPADDVVADALDRIAPALGDSRAATDAREALAILCARLEQGDGPDIDGVLRAVAAALDRLDRLDPTLAADVDAIRLAVGRQ